MENNNLIDAVKQQDLKLVVEILKSDVDLDSTTENGYSALMIAAENGDTKIARKLLLAGADTTIEASNGETALSLSSKNEHTEIAMLLESLNVKYDDIDNVDTLEDCLKELGNFNKE